MSLKHIVNYNTFKQAIEEDCKIDIPNSDIATLINFTKLFTEERAMSLI
jgi:hypothetical protein